MSGSAAFSGRHYTLERDNRELQQIYVHRTLRVYYTLERDGRELQLYNCPHDGPVYYTLEREIRSIAK